MTTELSPSISEALTHFVAAKKSAKTAQQSHQELGRFVAWVGRERKVSELSPSEVAEYAKQIGLGGSESVHRLSPVKVFLAYWKDQGWHPPHDSSSGKDHFPQQWPVHFHRFPTQPRRL